VEAVERVEGEERGASKVIEEVKEAEEAPAARRRR
jgi:hypothetical protein